MKLNWIVDSAIAFGLVFNAIYMLNLLSANDPLYSSFVLFLLPTELLNGYAFTDRMKRRLANKILLKSPLVQDTIAALSEHPGYTAEEATDLILSLCKDMSPENYDPILRSIASRPVYPERSRREQSMAGQFAQIQCKSFIGDATCENNARSPYLRCAIAPELNSCEGCKDYSKAENL